MKKLQRLIFITLVMTFFLSYQTVNAKIICKKATTLHTETCESEQKNYFCTGAGYKTGDAIEYGQIGNTEKAETGDAFDCDVNGDGVYDADKERFYYIDKTKENKIALIFYTNVVNRLPFNNNKNGVFYSANTTNFDGPITAIENLPSNEEWKNVELKNNKRNITDENGNVVITAFDYQKAVARLITYEEVVKNCGVTGFNEEKSLDKCRFLMENTAYKTNNMSSGKEPYGIWLENYKSDTTNSVITTNVMTRAISSMRGNSGGFGTRPVIEIEPNEIIYTSELPKNDIEKRVDEVEVEDTLAISPKSITILGIIIMILGTSTISYVLKKQQ